MNLLEGRVNIQKFALRPKTVLRIERYGELFVMLTSIGSCAVHLTSLEGGQPKCHLTEAIYLDA